MTGPRRRGGRSAWRAAAVVLAVVLAAPPVPAGAQDEIAVRLRARTFRYDRAARALIAAGDVVVVYQDVTISSDRLRVDLETHDVRAEGNVVIEVERYRARGHALDYNLTSRRGRIEQAATDYAGPPILGTVRVRAALVEGALGAAMVAQDGFCTTCEGSAPVAYLTARELRFYPNDRIIGRGVAVWIGGRRILTWPYFVIFLREQRASRLLPVLGYSDLEGYYLKTFYTYALTPDHYGHLRLDLMERLGIGYGLQHAYRFGGASGTAFLYRLDNRQTGGTDWRAVIDHHQRLGDVSARLYADHTALGAPLFRSTDTFASLDAYYHGPRFSTTLYQTVSSRDLGGLAFRTYTSRLAHAQQITPALRAEVTADLSRSIGPLGTDDEAFPRLVLQYRGRGYFATLVAEGRLDLDGDAFPGDLRFATERLPEVTVAADARLFPGTRVVYQLQGGLGRFRETMPGGTVDAVRGDAAVTVSGPLAESPRGFLAVRGQVRGSYYSTGDARAFVSGRVDYTRFLGDAWTAQAGMTYQDQVGRSPFTFDRVFARVAVADATVTYRRPNLIVTANTAFDANAGRWAPATVRAQFAPRSDWAVATALAYDPALGTLSRAELSFDVKLSQVWQVSYYGFYDGASGRLFHDRFTVARIWDECLATAVTYRGITNEVWFEAWLTAIPWARGRVGVGAQGNILFDQPWLGPRP